MELNIDTGVEEFRVNGRGVLRFNPADPNLYHRFFAAGAELDGYDAALTKALAALDGDEQQRAAAGLEGRIVPIPVGESVALKNFTLTAFPTMHDTPESVGYVLTGKDARFGVCTDTGCVTAEMLDALAGCDAAVIEANHDIDMLRAGRYPVYLKRRILSDRGHLSNEACAQLACDLAKTGVRSLVLGHLSRENNRPGLAERAVREALDGEGFSAVTLRVAPAEGDLELEVTPCCASN